MLSQLREETTGETLCVVARDKKEDGLRGTVSSSGIKNEI